MTGTQPVSDSEITYRRQTLLKRRPVHTAREFSRYYADVHGPLTANQAGLHKYTSRYLQNHVEELPDGGEPAFDAIAMTTQVPRADYSKTFFGEPDYANIKDDEAYLFDLGKVVSLLSREDVRKDGQPTLHKAAILEAGDLPDAFALGGVTRAVTNYLHVSTACALGGASIAGAENPFPFNMLVELWFESEADRVAAYRRYRNLRPDSLFLPVREVLIYGPEKPWS